MPWGTLAATILPGLIKGFAGGAMQPKTPAEIEKDMLDENRTAAGFSGMEQFGQQLSKPKHSISNFKR